MSQQPQLDLLQPELIWKATLLGKIEGLIPYPVFESLSKCGLEEIFRTCKGCGNWKSFPWRCSIKFCPLCNWRIARKRAEMLRLWNFQIKQPKHIVLTMRNFPVLTRRKVREFGRALAQLRRQKVWKDVQGGCVSTEITNEGRGWHLHAHILAEVRWIDAGELAKTWGRIIGQQFGIVKVKDARGQEYLGEVTKYVVKPSQLAGWEPNEINEFIRAVKGVRCFAAFGTLFHLQREIKKQLHLNAPPRLPCECGCQQFVYESETAAILHEVRRTQ